MIMDGATTAKLFLMNVVLIIIVHFVTPKPPHPPPHALTSVDRDRLGRR